MKKLLLVLVLLFACGCVEGIYTDSDTGEQTKYHYVDPNVADKYEDAAEGAVGTAAMLIPLLPWLAPFVTAGAGILATWKKLKPKLVASEEQKGDFVRGGELLAAALQEIKKNYPDTWEKISPMIMDSLRYSVRLENAVRKFRHLAPKE